MKRIISLLLVLLLGLSLAACSNEEKGKEEESLSDKVFGLNETADLDGLKFTVTKAEERSQEYLEAEEGKVYYVLEIEIQNDRDDDFASSSLMCYSIFDEDGREYDTALFTDLNGDLDGTVEAGGKRVGEIAFEVPSEGALTLNITPDLLGDTIKVAVR